MSDTVKLIIEIDDEDYNSILKTYSLLGDRASSRIDNKLFRAVKNGTILMSVIDNIRAEIQKEENIWYHDCEPDFSKNFDVIRVDTVLEIIDKYIKVVTE